LAAYLEGAQSLLPAALMIGVARSISLVGGAVALLRREAETAQPAALGAVAVRGVSWLTRCVRCSLADGDVAAFEKRAGSSRGCSSSVCAGLMDEV
jgi:hypothetical protein